MLFAGASVSAQTTTLKNFDVRRTGETVLLGWYVKSYNTCYDAVIHRSSDSIYFDPVGTIYGICEWDTATHFYSWEDKAPLPGTAWYYVELSNLVRSDIRKISGAAGEIRLAPNPCNEKAMLYFSNPDRQQIRLTLTDAGGKQWLAMETRESQVELQTERLPGGIYLLGAVSTDGKLHIMERLSVFH